MFSDKEHTSDATFISMIMPFTGILHISVSNDTKILILLLYIYIDSTSPEITSEAAQNSYKCPLLFLI